MRRRLLSLVVALGMVATACTSDGPNEATRTERGEATDGATDAPVAGSVPAPTTAPTTSPPLLLGGPQQATATCPAIPGQSPPDPHRPRYSMDVRVRPEDAAVDGRLTVRFRPDLTTDRLVFRLWPNGPRPAAAGAHIQVGPVFLGSNLPAATEEPDPTTLVVPLEPALSAGDEVEATLVWRLTLPGAANDGLAHQGDSIRLGSFFPILAWEPGVGWATEAPTSAFAEAATSPVADFSYSVTVPPGLSVLASGVQDGGRWQAVAMRDVAVSIGQFDTARSVAHAPGPVEVVVGVDQDLDDDPDVYLERVVQAMEDLARRFGAYPYPSYTLALTPGLSGGIEYPGHVMQGPGTLGGTTTHEVAHQWFYSLVGNDQARDPWLDEGLSTWAEAQVEHRVDEIRARTIPAAGRNRVGEPMAFWETRQDAYYRSVYVQGAQVLGALGDPELVDCALRLYVAANAFTIARPDDVRSALSQVFPDAGATLSAYGISISP